MPRVISPSLVKLKYSLLNKRVCTILYFNFIKGEPVGTFVTGPMNGMSSSRHKDRVTGATAYQLGNTSSCMLTEVKQR